MVNLALFRALWECIRGNSRCEGGGSRFFRLFSRDFAHEGSGLVVIRDVKAGDHGSDAHIQPPLPSSGMFAL